MFRIINHKSTKKHQNSPLKQEKKQLKFINIRGEQILELRNSIIVNGLRRKTKSEYILGRTLKIHENRDKESSGEKYQNQGISSSKKILTILENYRKRSEKNKKIWGKNKEQRVKLRNRQDERKEELKICQIALQKNGRSLQFKIIQKDLEKSKKKREQKKLILKNRSLKVLIIKQNKYACNKIKEDHLKHNLKIDINKV